MTERLVHYVEVWSQQWGWLATRPTFTSREVAYEWAMRTFGDLANGQWRVRDEKQV